MSSNKEDLVIYIPRRARKRKINVENWKKTRAKRARASGKEYISPHNQQQVPARSVGPPCNDNCFDRVGPGRINEIFENFWNIGNYDCKIIICQNMSAAQCHTT